MDEGLPVMIAVYRRMSTVIVVDRRLPPRLPRLQGNLHTSFHRCIGLVLFKDNVN